MEDDDEFGDLYTDVITIPSPFQPPSLSQPLPPPIHNTPAAAPAPTFSAAKSTSDSPSNFDINLNLNPSFNLNCSPPLLTHQNTPSRVSQDPPLPPTRQFPRVEANSPSLPPASETRVLENLHFDLNTDLAAAAEGDKKLDQSAASENLKSVEHEDDGSVIPGISIAEPNDDGFSQGKANGQGDDWESDSDDDLQIVLNENHLLDIHQFQAPNIMAENGARMDDDENGDPLVIVSDIDAVHHPPPEEQGWGEDSAQAPDGEGKETGEPGKPNPKSGYNSYGYHQYHSQFKYVRPGAAPLPGGSGGAVQVRPPVNTGVVGGRGRGDWRQAGMKGSLQKGFQSGFWGSNAAGRGFGGDFTLPSQKTIFEVNIDSFEEKPWNQPGSDVSDFFNFGLNEESWKEYCKNLEQLRMESTMKSKAHVLVVGSQSEQVYDPDLPPELAAAAAGVQDPSAENSNTQRADVGQNDIAKGSAVMRSILPIGRPIQVEIGSGVRIPTIDTRPPRMRDPDAVIEIVLQGSIEDDSSADRASREEDAAAEEDGEQTGNDHSDGFPQSRDRKKEDNARRFPRISASREDMPEDESSLPPEAELSSSSRDKSPVYLSDHFDASHEKRRMKGKIHKSSRSTSPVHNALDGRSVDDEQEVSDEDLEAKDSPTGLSFEDRVFSDDEPLEAEENDQKETEDVISNEKSSKHHSTRKLKLVSQAEPVAAKEIDDVSYAKATRSSDNSRETGTSQDHQKGGNVVDVEDVQDEHSPHARDLNRNRREDVQSHHRKDRDGSMDTGNNNNMAKRRDLHHSSYDKSDGFDRRRERGYHDNILQQGGDDSYGRKYRAEDSRKNELADGMISTHRGKVREGERSIKDEYLPSRKLMENGNWRGHLEKDSGFRIKEKSDGLKTRYGNLDDPHRKRKKDDEHARRGPHFEKDEIMRAHRDNSGHRKESEQSLDQRKREDLRQRDDIEVHRSIRSKDESWLQRERIEQRHRERDDGYHSKQSYEDKGRTGHSRKDGSNKDTGRNVEQLKRKDRVEDASSLQYSYEDKRSRQEKATVRSERAVLASDNQRVHERRPKENSGRPKQLEGAQHSTSKSLKKPQEEKMGRNEMAGLTGTAETIREKIEEASDVDQHRSKRGRSKMERWGSHQGRDGAGHSQAAAIPVSASEGKESVASKEKEPDKKHTENRHLDTVAKLKKRSERFKLPMPIEKDMTTIKKMESEPLSSAPTEAPANTDIKPERPPRKRRWISN